MLKKDMKLSKFVKLVDLDYNNVQAVPDSFIYLNYYGFDVNPEEFLEFAELDIKNNDKRSLVNALSNSKRAIDCQADKILRCFGINAERQNFPAKLELLQELGVVAPRIIRKVVQKRNYLEHKYKCPKKEQVEDSIDIANLFIEASNGTLRNFPTSFFVGDKRHMFHDDERFKHLINFEFEPDNKEFKLWGFKDGTKIGSTRVTTADKEYRTLIKLALSLEGKDIKVQFRYFLKLAIQSGP